MDEEIKKILDDFEKRIKNLEEKVNFKEKIKGKGDNDLAGVSKGVSELLKEDFFDTPKKIEEIISELERKGFFGERQKIDSSIRKTFFGAKKILDRMKKGCSWAYFKIK